MMNPQILNRESIAPRSSSWQQIEVKGEHPAALGKRRVVQVIDDEAIKLINDEFRTHAADPDFDGVLVDADHLKHDMSQKTEAYAWLMNTEIREGQLYGLLEWTDLGAGAVHNRRYKFFSTEYDAEDLKDLGSGKVRPTRLAGLSLTNVPNNKGGKRITNRKAGDAEQTQTKNDNDMKAIAGKLGLPEEATEDEIIAAIASLMEKAGKAETMEAEVKAEDILNRNAKRIPAGQRDAWKAELIKNREGAEKLILTLPEAEEKKGEGAIFNRKGAAVPDGKFLTEGGEEEGVSAAEEAKAARITNRARALTAAGTSLTSAYIDAAREIEAEDKAKG